MKNLLLLALTGISLALCPAMPKGRQPRSEGIQNYADLKKLFADPPSEFRSAPLWDWNEQISREGIDFQMKEFKKAGIGGVFVHPRPGLLTEYLSKDWFTLFDHTVQTGRKLGMKVWIYDENSYPSGFAGGHVQAHMPDSYKHGTGLSMSIQQELSVVPSETLAVVLKKDGTGFSNITSGIAAEQGKKGTYYVFRKTYPAPSPWYGGFPYVDLLYKGVTEKFLELTMTKGYERNRADFGKTLMGVFTDEPNLEAALPQGSMLRWTPDLWDAFQRRWGYDLRPNLPSLAEEAGNWKKVRHDYYELMLELFIDRWAKPWSAYCDDKQLKWTGHYWEHGWPFPTDGSDEAAFYIYHQQPGVDMLGNRLDTGGLGGQFGNERAVRELLSAANQAGRTRTLSETYGGGGWDMNFETQKRLVDWQCVMGVNFVNQHLSYYSLNGVRKFDYPPSFSYHEPWWGSYKLMGDYIGRICLAVSSGKQINHTLVLQPNTSAWMYFSRTVKNSAMDSIGRGFKRMVYRLEQLHVEYDLGSEHVMKTLGSVTDGKLKVGQRDYSLVVIPAEMENIDTPTLALLRQYMERGGKLLSFNGNVACVDGVQSSAVKELADTYPGQWITARELDDPAALKLLTRDDFTMTDKTKNGMLYHQRRILGDGQIVFIVNSHTSKKAAAEVTMKGSHVSRLDLVTGAVSAYPAVAGGGMVTFAVDLDPVGSALFAVTTGKPGGRVQAHTMAAAAVRKTLVEGTGPVVVKRESDNILIVNYLDLKTQKSEIKDTYFMNALIGLFNEKGVAFGNPWQHKIQYRKNYLALDSLFRNDAGFEASYHFEVDSAMSAGAMRSIRAVVERPALWTVSINGHAVSPQQGTYWIDRQFPLYAVGGHLRPGRNTITLTAPRMHILAEVMPIYLIGDFLVTPAAQGFTIAPGAIGAVGSWREAGLPFYSQKVAYTQTFVVTKLAGSSFTVTMNKWNGTVAEVWVNGQHAGEIAWQPNTLDVSPMVKEGTNTITVKVIGSLKNTFGHFYSKEESWIYGPFNWNDAPTAVPGASEYYLNDYGLFEPFTLTRVD